MLKKIVRSALLIFISLGPLYAQDKETKILILPVEHVLIEESHLHYSKAQNAINIYYPQKPIKTYFIFPHIARSLRDLQKKHHLKIYLTYKKSDYHTFVEATLRRASLKSLVKQEKIHLLPYSQLSQIKDSNFAILGTSYAAVPEDYNSSFVQMSPRFSYYETYQETLIEREKLAHTDFYLFIPSTPKEYALSQRRFEILDLVVSEALKHQGSFKQHLHDIYKCFHQGRDSKIYALCQEKHWLESLGRRLQLNFERIGIEISQKLQVPSLQFLLRCHQSSQDFHPCLEQVFLEHGNKFLSNILSQYVYLKDKKTFSFKLPLCIIAKEDQASCLDELRNQLSKQALFNSNFKAFLTLRKNYQSVDRRSKYLKLWNPRDVDPTWDPHNPSSSEKKAWVHNCIPDGHMQPVSQTFQEGNSLPKKCTPRVLYSWGPEVKLNAIKDSMGGPAWKNRINGNRTLFLALTPAMTMIYGESLIRFKVRPSVEFTFKPDQFLSRGSCDPHPQSYKDQNIHVRYSRSLGLYEFHACSPKVFESWSYDLPQNYDEVVKDWLWIKHRSDRALYYYPEYQHGREHRLLGFDIDGHKLNNSGFMSRMNRMIDRILNNRGAIHYNPEVKNPSPHFKAEKPIWFNES